MNEDNLFDLMSDYFELTGDIIETAGGKIVKFIGDESLIVFPEDKVDEGVQALKKLKDETDSFFKEKDLSCRLGVKMHFGQVICGRLGTKTDKTFDILGDNVNYAARLQSYGFAMTPQVFRKLKKKTRTLFKKHTPPIRYIPVEESHKDPLKGFG